MPRKLRVEYPGAIYHAMNRGDRREPIFRDDEDRKLFLTLKWIAGEWQRAMDARVQFTVQAAAEAEAEAEVI